MIKRDIIYIFNIKMTKISELIKRWSEISIQLETLENTKKTLLSEQMTITEQLIKLSDNLESSETKEKSKKSKKSEKTVKAVKEPTKEPVKSKSKKMVKKAVMKASETSDSDTNEDSD